MACMEKPPHAKAFTMGSPERHTDACRVHGMAVFSDIGRLDPGFQCFTLLERPRETTLHRPTAADYRSSPSMSVTSRPDTPTDGHSPSPPPARIAPAPARVAGPPAAEPGPAPASGSAGGDPLPAEAMHRDPTPPDRSGSGSDTEYPPASNTDMPVVQWRKRLVKSASINFHSIADLVRPCGARTPPESAGEGRRTVHGTYPAGTTSACTAGHRSNQHPQAHHGERRADNTHSPPSDRADEYINVVDGAEDEGAVSGTTLRPTGGRRTAADLLGSTQCRASSHPAASSSSSSSSSDRPGPAAGSRPERDGPSPPAAATSGAEAEAADPSRLRKGRTIYKAQQVYVLEQVFSRTHYPDPEVIETLARELDISENKIKVWFQNKRARWRRRAAETGLPPQPIGFTLTGTPGGLHPTSWPHSPLPQGLLMPQPVYNSPYPGGQVVSPRPGFHAVAPYGGMAGTPLYLDSAMMAAAKGLSPTVMPYGSYSLLPSHIWTETSKLHSGT